MVPCIPKILLSNFILTRNHGFSLVTSYTAQWQMIDSTCHASSSANSIANKLNLKLQTLTRMWANAQPDGRPAKHRWRPLFNAAKFGWRPLLDAVQ